MAVGIKSSTDGSLENAINAVKAARQPHSTFTCDGQGNPAIVETLGNPFAHVCLRGGRSGSNLNLAAARKVEERLAEGLLKRPIVMDCSHAYLQKDYRRQKGNALDVARMFAEGTR